MSEPLELFPREPKPLTERQEGALAYVRSGGIDGRTTDELGAWDCERRGRHGTATRCDFDVQNGKQLAHALEAKGLVTYRRSNRARNVDAAWIASSVAAEVAAELPSGMTEAIPF